MVKWLASSSIRNKLAGIVLFTMGTALVISMTGFTVWEIRRYREFVHSELRTVAEVVAESAAAPLAFDDRRAAAEALAALNAVPSVAAAVVYSRYGEIFARYNKPEYADLELSATPGATVSRSVTGMHLVTVLVRVDSEVLGTLLVVAKEDGYARTLAQYLPMLIIFLASGAVLAWVLSYLLRRVVTDPVLRLADTARLISNERNYSVRAVQDSDDEVGLLIQAFNDMLTQIQRQDHELTRHKNHLEDEVEERTAELTSLNKELLAAKDRAEQASKHKGEFLANVSHELRTPLNGVIGMTRLVLEMELSEEQRDYLETAWTSAESLLGLLNDLLDVSKIEAGKLTIEKTPLDLRVMTAELVKTLGIRTSDKQVRLTRTVDDQVPALLIGDPVRLRQILTNLIGNAVKFTERGGIFLGIDVAEKDWDEVLIHCVVRDTGIGISADKLDSIFEAFSQADGSTARRFGGTGLGLSICSRLVKMMGGRIWVESELGAGSAFHFTAKLGVAASGAEAPPASERAAPRAGRVAGLKILVAEDNLVNQKVIEQLLKKRGHSVSVVSNGRDAARAVAENAFDLVLMDIQMPEISGLDAARMIRAAERTAGEHTPIVALTASAMLEDRAICLEAGMDDYLTKPIQPELLERMIALHARHRRPEGTSVLHSAS